jgi:UDP-2-acetamido-2,6-beta-L-arabino-hexul-4-ose reductase
MKKVKLRKHEDGRGYLVENTLPKILKESKHFFISKSKPGVIRGNHYHLRKSEWFYLIQGRGVLYIEDIKNKKRNKIILDDKDNLIINLGPNKAHAFKNTGEKEFILLAFVSEVFNRRDPDTFNYKVI